MMMWSLLIASSILPNPSAFQSPFFQRRSTSVALHERRNNNYSRRRHCYFHGVSHADADIGVFAEDDTDIISSSSSSSSRRNFLKHFSITSIISAPIILSPTLTFAYNDDEDDGRSVDDSMGEESSITAPATAIDTTNEEKAVTNNNNNNNQVTIDKLLKEENELLNNIIQEEKDESKSIEEEEVLMNELVNEIQQLGKESNTNINNTSSDDIDDSPSSPTATATTTITKEDEIANKIKLDTQALIKEEERIKNETIDIITKLEDMESQVQSLDYDDSVAAVVVVDEENKSSTTTNSDNTATATTTTTVEVIVDKLKERVTQKEDLISRLKEQSLLRDMDPKTGKYKVMTPNEYKHRVQTTDVDFIQFLKDTIGNEKEIKADLTAFEGLIMKEIGPLIVEIQKDISPMIDMVEKEWDKDGIPVMKEMIQQLKDTTKSNTNYEVVDEVQQRVGDLIDKLRSMF
jgi:hypothetical protein